MLEGNSLNFSISELTDRTAALSWNYTGTDAVRFDYVVVTTGTIPTADTVPSGTLAFGPAQYSELWGKNREKWDPAGKLPDMTGVGYMKGEAPIPDWPIGVNVVTDHGAVGDPKVN